MVYESGNFLSISSLNIIADMRGKITPEILGGIRCLCAVKDNIWKFQEKHKPSRR